MTILEWRNAVSKSKFNARTERKLIQTAKAITRATSNELNIFLKVYGANVCDFFIRRKLISSELAFIFLHKKLKLHLYDKEEICLGKSCARIIRK